MANFEVERTVFKNGFQIATIHIPTLHSITNFLAIRSGSRYEIAANNGIAHFLEHMVFKGTRKYPSPLVLARSIEGVGGYFNAYTSLDHTSYWNTVPLKHWQIGLELPFELAFRPLLLSADLERERKVIIEEIRMYQDTPMQYVEGLSQELVFAGNPLSRQIIGSIGNIKKMTIEQFHDYRRAFYHSGHALFIVVGNLKGVKVKEVIASQLKTVPEGKAAPLKLMTKPSSKAVKLLTKKTDQTHFVLAVSHPILKFAAAERFGAEVLSAILGQGMSSRLFLNVRERRGLAYSIRSSVEDLEDTGVISIYGGVNTAKFDEALQAVADELKRLQDEAVEEEELERAKTYLIGSYDLRSDNPSALARWYGADYLLGRRETFAQAQAKIAAVSSEDILRIARVLFERKYLTLAVIGPQKNDKNLRRFIDSLSLTE